jgi:TIR domain/NB-ARC domain
MSKVFLSYSHKDQEFVEDLYRRLTGDGVECFFDKVSIQWGDNWVLKLEEGINECDFIVFILTPDFCQSMWSQKEYTAVVAALHPGMKERIKPLLLKECGDQLPRFFKAINYINVSTDELFESEYPRICSNLGGNPTEPAITEPLDRTQLPPLRPLPSKHRMPYRSLGNSFVGRVTDLWTIDDGLAQSRTTVIQAVGMVMGMGGIGKTQLAVEYAHRFGHRFTGGVFWVDAEMGRMTMTAQVAEAAGIQLDKQKSEQGQLNMLWQQLSHEPVLIVLDNFPEGEKIEAWLPLQKSIYTLVTSRRKDFYNYFAHDLEKLGHHEALGLLNSGKRHFEVWEAKELIDTLEGMPLALELVKHFLNLRPELSITGLMEEMKCLGEMEALDIFAVKYGNQLPTGHGKQVAATFRMGWDLASTSERKVLQTISLLAPVPVPLRLLRRIFNVRSKRIFYDPLWEAINRLVSKISLLECDDEQNPKMHRLISHFVRTTINKKDKLYQDVIVSMATEIKFLASHKDTIHEVEKLIPHVNFLLSSTFIKPEQILSISNTLQYWYKKYSEYILVEKFSIDISILKDIGIEKNLKLETPQKKPLIFICYAKEDLDDVKSLYEELKQSEFNPWMDIVDILPGQKWDFEIRHALKDSDFALICLSQFSVRKEGYLNKEIKWALNRFEEMPEGKIFLIPVRLENCEIPDRLSKIQAVDYFASDGFDRLVKALNYSQKKL